MLFHRLLIYSEALNCEKEAIWLNGWLWLGNMNHVSILDLNPQIAPYNIDTIMIVLSYPQANTQTEEWVDALKDLSLAHKLEVDEKLEQPQLSHSGKAYAGKQAISKYLDQLHAEREQWWYCTCDRNGDD